MKHLTAGEYYNGWSRTLKAADARRHAWHPPSFGYRYCQFGHFSERGHDAHGSEDRGDVHALYSQKWSQESEQAYKWKICYLLMAPAGA